MFDYCMWRQLRLLTVGTCGTSVLRLRVWVISIVSVIIKKKTGSSFTLLNEWFKSSLHIILSLVVERDCWFDCNLLWRVLQTFNIKHHPGSHHLKYSSNTKRCYHEKYISEFLSQYTASLAVYNMESYAPHWCLIISIHNTIYLSLDLSIEKVIICKCQA